MKWFVLGIYTRVYTTSDAKKKEYFVVKTVHNFKNMFNSELF